MLRLSGLDAGFLYSETPSLHFHTLKVAVMDLADLGGTVPFARFREGLGANLHRIPPFRRRLVEVPFGLDHPRWIEDPDFDLSRHLRHVQARAPGDERELARIASEVASRPLDRRHPLWEITLVEGLAHGRVGFIAKIHHAVADGVAANQLLMNVLTVAPETPREVGPRWQPDRVPSRARLLADGARAVVGRTRRFPALARHTAAGLRSLLRHLRDSPASTAVPFRTPPTPFNAALTPRRSLATVELSFPRMKDAKDRTGTSLNDVFLAVCTGALRRWLNARGIATDRPLIVGVPASVGADDQRLHGNRVSNLFSALPVGLADPAAQLRAVHDVMLDAKERHRRLGADLLERWAELAPPGPYTALSRAWSRYRFADRVRPPINLVVSNVPGPRSPLYFGRAKLISFHSIGPILEGIGLNITAWSYVDRLEVALLACPDHVADLWSLAEEFPRALDELCAATLGPS